MKWIKKLAVKSVTENPDDHTVELVDERGRSTYYQFTKPQMSKYEFDALGAPTVGESFYLVRGHKCFVISDLLATMTRPDPEPQPKPAKRSKA